jgi:RNA polymerase sigma factor (sigma-70 family)
MEADGEDDADLLRAHRAGNPRAFARLYDRYDRPCFRFISRMLGSSQRDAAEDLHQETWLAVAHNARAFDPGRASFRAWLFTIARNKVFDQFRRQKVSVLASADGDEVAMVSDTDPTPFDRLESLELAERLVAAVEALPLEQRSTFILFADSGLTLEEIAEATGVGAETAKSRLRYARARLKEALAGERSDHV